MSVVAGFQPANLTLIAPRNGVMRLDFTFTDEDTALAIPLTGWSARMQLRDSAGGTLRLEVNSAGATAAGSVITFTDPTNGVLELYIANPDLVSLPAGSPVSTPLQLAYDLVLTEAGGDFDPWLIGAFVVTEGVTR